MRRRRGLSLAELLIAGTIMTMLAGGMGMLVTAVHSTGSHCRGQSAAVQHGRVTLDRLDRTIHAAAANEQFPGCLVVSTSVSGYAFPDTLVVWSPAGGAAANPTGLPQVCELLIYCPDPNAPNRLLEIRPVSTNTATVPAISNTSSWATLVSGLKTATSSTQIELTSLVRTSSSSTNSTGTPVTTSLRGCVRFLLLMSPTAAEWTSYQGGTLDWDELTWPLDLYSTQTGIRRVVCQTEIQIVPDSQTTAGQTSLPFFGSSVLTYNVSK